MCATLGIKIIPASSPQAKGRIERNHGTHQDRLVKKLRRTGIADLEAANAFLAAYWRDHNQRFAQPPASAEDFHAAVPRRVQLDQVFRLEEQRTVSNDWVVRYDNRLFRLERQGGRPPARSHVLVYEAKDGQIDIRYRDCAIRWTKIAAPTKPAERATTSPPRALTATTRIGQLCESADHSWRHHAVEDRYAYQQMAKDRRAWERLQP